MRMALELVLGRPFFPSFKIFKLFRSSGLQMSTIFEKLQDLTISKLLNLTFFGEYLNEKKI